MFLQTIYTDFNRSSNTEFHYSDPETYNLKHNQKEDSIEHWCMAWYCANYRGFRLEYWSNIFV